MPPKSHFRPAFASGVVAALVATVVMLGLGLLVGAPVPPQLIADRLTTLIPLDLFSAVLGSLESAAKPLVFAGVIVGQVIAGGLASVLAERALHRGVSPSGVFTGLLAGIWAILALVVAPIGEIGLAGRESFAGVWTTSLSFLLIALSFAAVVTAGLTATEAAASAPDQGRRRFLRVAAFGVPALLATAYLGRYGWRLAQKSAAAPAATSEGQLPPALTPTEDFYIVSKNFVDPNVSLLDWKLDVGGLVATPRSFTYEELRSRPSVTRVTTLECISNEVGGDYISTGEWTGFPMKDLLDEVGVQPEAVDVVLRAADDYADSFPLAAALHPDTLLVYDLNGQPLGQEHGFPLRVIVPGIFGMKNVKWLTGIELVDNDFVGYWQKRGWSDVATVQTMSRIDIPRNYSKVPLGRQSIIGGIAFAGNRGISRVEVSTDDGETWSEAELQPPLSNLTWVLWTLPWIPTTTGWSKLVVRAWDGEGTMQPEDEQPPLPDGATGWHRIRVQAVEAD